MAAGAGKAVTWDFFLELCGEGAARTIDQDLAPWPTFNSRKDARTRMGRFAIGEGVARVAKRLCPRCLRSTLQERKLAKSSGPMPPAPYQGVDGDAVGPRRSNRSKELFSVSSISTI